MIATTHRHKTALAAAAVLALGLYGCDGGGGGSTTTTSTPADVDLSRVTAGVMAETGTVTIAAGQSEEHGDISFSCAAGGPDCVVMVMVDANGAITATSTGGTVTVMNSADYNLQMMGEADSIHAATGIELVERGFPRLVSASSSGTDYLGVHVGATDPENPFGAQWSRAIPWVNSAGDVHFSFSLDSGLSTVELDPLAWLGRSIDTSVISDYTEDTSHALGTDWRVLEATKEYAATGTLRVSAATDVHNAGTVERPWVGYGDFGRTIVLDEDDVPALPAGQDWQGVNVVNGVRGLLDDVPGRFSCVQGAYGCYLEFWRGADAEGYYPYGGVVFTRDDNGATEELPAVTDSQTVLTADYLVFGIWQYVPEDITAVDDFEFGAFAGGGDPLSSSDAAANLYGTATYDGSAHGMYYTGRSSQTPTVGSFDARVTLEADFGDPLDIYDYGTLSGTADNFQYSGAASGFPTQLILQGESALETDINGNYFVGAFEQIGAVGVVSDGQPTPSWSGAWQAVFLGYGASPNDHPTGIAGTFDATNDEDGMVGAFGARR